MYLTLLAHIYPELALAETRTIRTRGHPELPDDEYALLEAYCLDPKCDCRRVMINVNSRRDTEAGKMRYLASISYGFDRDDELAGPELDVLNPQSQYAEALFDLVEEVLDDPAYVARLKEHYRLAKKASSSPDPSVRQTVARLRAEEEEMLSGRKPSRARPETSKGRVPPSSKAGGQAPDDSMGESVPKAMRPTYDAVVAITDSFCREHLDDEYAQLARKLAAALARKRPSPLGQGKAQMWACGIVYALGSVNFLWDKTQTPHMSAGELCQRFGVGKSGCSARARQIMDSLRIRTADPKWYRPSKLDDNPMAWMIMVDGLIVDARRVPRVIQEEAVRKGLIPYLPGTRGERT
jgi:hypothetical protein